MGFIGISGLLTCFWLLYFLGQMVRLTSQLEGSGVEGKRTCPPLSPQWSPLPQLLLAGLVFLKIGKLWFRKSRWAVSTAGHLYSMWTFFPPWSNISFNDPQAAIAVNLLWTSSSTGDQQQEERMKKQTGLNRDILHNIQVPNFISINSGWLNDQKTLNSQF